MLLGEVLEYAKFEEVYKCLREHYAGCITSSEENIRKGFNQIKNIKTKNVDEPFIITISLFKEDGHIYYDVSGLSKKDESIYSIVFEDWDNWVSYELDDDLFERLSYSEIVAHCFWEMSWLGWTIEDRLANIKREEKEGRIESELENERDVFIKANRVITNDYLNRLIRAYKASETCHLESSIELIIEDFINNDLVLDDQLNLIKMSFEDEDIVFAIDKWFKRRNK